MESKEEHVYTVQITIIGEQPNDLAEEIKRKLCADQVVIIKQKTFPALK